ncbi:hypothetical protein BOSE62_30289 [Bosea sp. 62]|nr:hypothetical protein BOSE46_130244 [Bosea sp. 46]CAD5267527.1 hypothetical protein BOSE21B_111332 [Bosea sp. 21B]CAD5271500.1 hypothetical protein BOSE7B_30063 [Bosea sp. 7B]VVT55701.1 hypothetical protein BOS5A_120064 [Bosea sp. EC-HK365B]VXB86782.1 hypothetical protein BOSE29B_130174 [Bosea sp. 29B]VXC16891.1 hypothetical protein BOSE62_30289 [Bosea sp. 62]VXC25492.1 hypothetical protein BOSE125_180299 [Bosea sp. 125]VXC68256.1 hypothetical protein BOSE127_40062 [Bosea sp. 127]
MGTGRPGRSEAETRDPCLNLIRKSSGMDPGSSLRSVRDDSRKLMKGARPFPRRRAPLMTRP